MTDVDLIRKKLAQITTYVHELRTHGHPERLEDVREERFILYTLQIAIQAALDVASHIVSDDRLGEPSTNRELFELLAANGWVDRELAAQLVGMTGFRNVVVHGYADVNRDVVRTVVGEHLGDFDDFVSQVRARLGGESA